jgi:hypothetical protein
MGRAARPRGAALLLLLACAAARAADDAPAAAAAAAGCSREAPCLNFGSCELHTGACACPHGFGGRRCELALLSACAVTRDPPPPPRAGPPGMLCASGRGVAEHGQEGLKSCECLRQCVAHEGGGLSEHGLCFERPGGPEAQHSAFPAPEEAGVTFWSTSNPAAPGEALSRDAYIALQASHNRLEHWEARPSRGCRGSAAHARRHATRRLHAVRSARPRR